MGRIKMPRNVEPSVGRLIAALAALAVARAARPGATTTEQPGKLARPNTILLNGRKLLQEQRPRFTASHIFPCSCVAMRHVFVI